MFRIIEAVDVLTLHDNIWSISKIRIILQEAIILPVNIGWASIKVPGIHYKTFLYEICNTTTLRSYIM